MPRWTDDDDDGILQMLFRCPLSLSRLRFNITAYQSLNLHVLQTSSVFWHILLHLMLSYFIYLMSCTTWYCCDLLRVWSSYEHCVLLHTEKYIFFIVPLLFDEAVIGGIVKMKLVHFSGSLDALIAWCISLKMTVSSR